MVAVSSGAHGMGVRWDDMQFERGYDRWQAYGQAKAANVLFAVQLDALGRDAGVRAFAVHPGSILTLFSATSPRRKWWTRAGSTNTAT